MNSRKETRNTEDPPQSKAIFAALEERPTVAAYARAARELIHSKDRRHPLKVALLASYTIDGWVPYLTVESARRGLAVEAYVGPFNNVTQELVNPASGCHLFGPDVVLVAQLLDDICPALADGFLGLSADQVGDLIDDAVTRLISPIQTFRTHCDATVLIHNFALPSSPRLGICEGGASESLTHTIRQLNERVREAVAAVAGTYLVDFDRCCADVGYARCRDEKMWYFGRAPISTELAPHLARVHAACFHALVGSPRKCLVLDLDNTLWGGVLGEDGPGEVQLGATFPGNVYKQLQKELLELKHRGIVLAINSKNNQDEVQRMLADHPDMVLRPDDFAAQRINWQPKPQNMLELADELNIGTDSFVFLDDNPAECELMRQTLPEVETVQASDPKSGRPDPLRTLRWLRETLLFDRLNWTSEDRQRTEMYRQQSERTHFHAAALSMDEFLTGLEMEADIEPANALTLSRVAELMQKTNQFNLTTRRYQRGQIEQLSAGKKSEVFTIRLRDRFGDNGIVGAAILRFNDSTAAIDTFLLSCRVIGRDVETALLWFLVDRARAEGATEIYGEFIPTKKNRPAADFFQRHGFSPADAPNPASKLGLPEVLGVESNEATRRWKLSVADLSFSWPRFIAMRQVVGHQHESFALRA